MCACLWISFAVFPSQRGISHFQHYTREVIEKKLGSQMPVA